jgi:hypothetical protein
MSYNINTPIEINDDEFMSEVEQTEFVRLLEKFIETSGLDRIEACKKAQELLTIINE